jgi:predicted transcriptional regulator
MAKGFIKSNEVIYKDENGIERKRTVSKEFTQKVDQDKFYMTFIDYVKWIYGLTTITTLKVLYKLLEIAEYNTGEVSLSPGKRQEIMEDIGIKKSAFTQALNQLVESGAIEVKYKTDKETGELIPIRGEYRISPEMFWKGELKKRTELKVTFEAKYTDDLQSDEF